MYTHSIPIDPSIPIVLHKAKTILETGWCQLKFRTIIEKGERQVHACCLVAAISDASFILYPQDPQPYPGGYSKTAWSCYAYLTELLGPEAPVLPITKDKYGVPDPPAYPVSILMKWNDLPDRTQSDVLDLLQTAISTQSILLEIQETAYFKYLARGSIPGHDLDDWLAAEQEVLARYLVDGDYNQWYAI